MYNPLIEIRHKDGSKTHVRAEDIVSIRDWREETSVKTTDNRYVLVTNIQEVISRVQEVENKNRLAQIQLYEKG